jgi:hypothetical protein
MSTPRAKYRKTPRKFSEATEVGHHMSQASQATFATTLIEAARSKYSYSLKRWNPFDAWQDHVRKSAPSVGSAFAPRADRDLRRAVITG